jgi:hypothetical protein
MNQRMPDIDEAKGVSAKDVDEFDFDADEVEVETYQPVFKPNATASLKVSRRAAKPDAKSEMFARASALAKKKEQSSKQTVDRGAEIDLDFGQHIEDKEESIDEAKTTCSRRKSTIVTATKATKAKVTIRRAAESDDESEYQPTRPLAQIRSLLEESKSSRM